MRKTVNRTPAPCESEERSRQLHEAGNLKSANCTQKLSSQKSSGNFTFYENTECLAF